MAPDKIFEYLIKEGYDFFTGVPDSALKDLQNSINESGYPNIIATNEAQAVAIAFGAQLTGKKACVYMQNSGLGNAVNPLTSLCIPFGVSPLMVIGHRHTLPQHKVMGEIDGQLMELMGYNNYILIIGENNVK
jgi:phosphonopyruvate decarboxylase